MEAVMKRMVLGLAILISTTTFANGYKLVQKSNGDRYFINTCLSEITDQKAKDLLIEVKYGNGTEKLEQFATDLNTEASLEEIAAKVSEVERANDLCYAGEVYGYEVLKHIVESSLSLPNN